MIAVFLVLGIIVFVRRALAEEGPSLGADQSVYDFKVETIEGAPKSLADYRGQVLLIVNTASRCGFTPQYAGLEKLYEKYKIQGLVVLAFPANDFMGQEPGDDGSIKKFCELKYKTSFPLFSKISVKGKAMAPLYRYLTTASGFNGKITWNFNKFLVNRKGRVIARFGSRTDPMSPDVERDVIKALAG